MKSKHKILVLSDFNTSTLKIVKSSVSLAKIVNADINFFYVKKPTEVVEKESQLSAMRIINEEYLATNKKIKDLINPISADFNVAINHQFTIGNVKNEIGKCIDEYKPDIIVLGKRKSKIVSFIGDNITQYVLDKHQGTIVIAGDENSLEPNEELSLGLFNNAKLNNAFTEQIISSTQKKITSFKIAENAITLKEDDLLDTKKIVEYVFEKGDNALKSISNYLSKSNVNLLFVNREKNIKNSTNTTINEVIKNLNCSLILTT